jgi:phosphatidylinositol 3,5-bisphosphate 5-phosphatase
LWKLDSDQHYNIGRQGTLNEEIVRCRLFSVYIS